MFSKDAWTIVRGSLGAWDLEGCTDGVRLGGADGSEDGSDDVGPKVGNAVTAWVGPADGGMDAVTDGCMDAVTDGCMDAAIDGCMDAAIDGCIDAVTDGCMDSMIEGAELGFIEDTDNSSTSVGDCEGAIISHHLPPGVGVGGQVERTSYVTP